MASKTRTETRLHVVHCSLTHSRQDIGKRTINKAQMKDGVYSDSGLTGYHTIIRRSGLVELGRHLAVVGQHTLGWNDVSVASCLVGGARKARADEGRPDFADTGMMATNNYEMEQLESLSIVHMAFQQIWPTIMLVPASAIASTPAPCLDLWRWQTEAMGYNDRLRFAQYKAALDAEWDERKDEG